MKNSSLNPEPKPSFSFLLKCFLAPNFPSLCWNACRNMQCVLHGLAALAVAAQLSIHTVTVSLSHAADFGVLPHGKAYVS